MGRLARYRVLFCGLLSPPAAIFFYAAVNGTLMKLSPDHEKDWPLRLSVSTLAMTVPFLVTLLLALKDHRRQRLSLSARVGLGIALLSLIPVWFSVRDGITRAKQTRNLAMRGVPAPAFATLDLLGTTQRLSDQKGKVVLVNIWATWCEPCRNEMPKLDRLYQNRKDQGFIVFGLSDEDTALQRKFLKEIPVSYPLLTIQGEVPRFYRDIARYPAMFLIDRRGQLQPAPSPDQPFEKVEAAVDALLSVQ